MNAQAALTVNAIKAELTKPKTSRLLLRFVLFGSQIRGTETPKSDLDVLYIARNSSMLTEFYKRISAVTSKVKKDNGAPVYHNFAFYPKTIRKFANIYGTVEYNVLRGLTQTHTLYEALDAKDVIRRQILVADDDDDLTHSLKWLRLAEQNLLRQSSHNFYQHHTNRICFSMAYSIACALRACLLNAHIRFSSDIHMRDMRKLYDLLPLKYRMPMPDFAELDKWFQHGLNKTCTLQDADYATKAAKAVYKFTQEMISSPVYVSTV